MPKQYNSSSEDAIFTLPTQITKESLENHLSSALSLTTDRGFMPYSSVTAFDDAFFKIYGELELLVKAGKSDLSYETAMSLCKTLSEVETDDDMFPVYEIEELCKLVDPDMKHPELWELKEIY